MKLLDFKSFVLLESKQEIVRLGYPKVIADIFYNTFGKHAFTIAKWNKDYTNYWPSENDWWRMANDSTLWKHTLTLHDLVRLYESADDIEKHRQVLDDLDMDVDIDEYELEEHKESLKKQIEKHLLETTFFTWFTLIQDVLNGKLKDLAPYKNLHFTKAQEKYDKKNIFKDQTPIRTYPNGARWIDVGKRCYILGKRMKNCGSAGLMSIDPDRTMLALFDRNNKPHVVVTYSPNENEITGDEGVASTPVKERYMDYIIDLTRHLNASFDVEQSKSKLLKLKYLLGNKLKHIEIVHQDTFTEIFRFITRDNKEYYTDGYSVLSKESLQKVMNLDYLDFRHDNILITAFHNRNKQTIMNAGIQYKRIDQF